MSKGKQQVAAEIGVRRTDPVYMAHAYLTKVPVAAIEPFIEAFTQPGDVVLDPFAGSGMTGVAAAILGRRARLFDISVLGQHIGRNYLNLVESDPLRKHAHAVVEAALRRLGDVYGVVCAGCETPAKLVKAIWSMQVACAGCGGHVNFYRCLEAAAWDKKAMRCPRCGEQVTSRAPRVGEEPIVDSIECACSRTQQEQPHSPPLCEVDAAGLNWPSVEIGRDRQMYQASALGRHGLTSTASFFSRRNLAVLAALFDEINRVDDEAIRMKLRFGFTAILTRASKRYQWSRQRPLNAANANYYVAPIFYEWNVFDLFERKIEALIRSDDSIRARLGHDTLPAFDNPDVTYEVASATALPLPDGSIDYVFTDPPFGSNIFYSDMNLFQEAWLGGVTDPTTEAVVDRADTGAKRSAERYEVMLTDALRECRRVLKTAGKLSLVFGNSTGGMWALLQRAIRAAGFAIDPELISLLDKGQRSVKGLASGFENVATVDLILTLRPAASLPDEQTMPKDADVEAAIRALLPTATSASHLYVALLRQALRAGWDLTPLDLRRVNAALRALDVAVHTKTGRLTARR